MDPSTGQYQYSAGSAGGFALWDFEFAANVGSRNLQDVQIDLWIDVDPAAGASGVNYLTLEDIFNPNPIVPAWSAPISYLNAAAWGEHEVGIATTAAGGGSLYTSETGTNTLVSYSVVQNAENMGEVIDGFDPNIPGTYDFKLTAVDRST
ncbi:MAG: hypothetical protein U9N87_03465, partial [Planctomycetota bacterium]|nr:hypothetical protein [Planctomycetota bacterium]